MPRRYYSSVAVATTLAADVNNVGTSIQVSSLTGFPAQAPFTIIVDQDQPTEEVMEVTNVASLVLTVARGIDGTSAVAHTTGAIVRHGVSARDFDEANSHVNNSTTDVHSQYVQKSTVTTAGDLLVRNSSGLTRLPIGASGQVLTVDESAATKVKWESPSGGGSSESIPTGTLMPYVGSTAPLGWLLCQGQEVSQGAYPALYALCGTNFGTAGAGLFRLPDLRGRSAFGFTSADSNFNALGKTGGASSVTLTTSHLPAHTHSTPAHDHTVTASGLTASSAGDHGHTVSSSALSSGSHTHSSSETAINVVQNISVSTNTNTSGGGSLTRVSSVSPTTGKAPLTITSSGDHSHSVSSTAQTSGSHTHSISGNVTFTTSGASTSGSTGSGSALGVLNPFLVLNFIIKAA